MSRRPGSDAGARGADRPGVFLSYGRADDERFVAALHRRLVGRGLGVWWDRASMPSRSLTFLQEIRDAIAAAERFVLVVGPAALRSDYVRAEWQYALALSKPVIPVLRAGEMEDLPPEVGRVHSIDARTTRPARAAFDELVRVLGAPLPPLGPFLSSIPALPPHFQPRTAELSRLAELLLEDQDRPVTVTGSQRVLVLHGLPGMGKSVTAAAFARSTETRRSFRDGVLWLSAHRARATDVTLLEADGTMADEARSILVVVDDAGGLAEVEPVLNRLGVRGRMLVTSRNAGLARSLGARELALGALAPDATLRQLADSAGSSMEALPTTAHAVATWCAGLPFASAVCGAMVRAGRTWDDVLDALHQADLAYLAHAVPNYPHASLLACLAVAVEGLPETEAEALADLRVYHRGVPVPDALVTRLWASRRQLGARAARDTLARLADRALVRWDGEPRTVQLHALEHDLLRARGSDVEPLHRAIVDMYRQDCPGSWAAGPNDGYFFEWFLHHLASGGDRAGTTRLLLDPAWMQAKLDAVGLHALIADYGVGLGDEPQAEQGIRRALLHAAPAIQAAPDHMPALLADRMTGSAAPSTGELAGNLRSAVPCPRFRLLTPSLVGQTDGLIVTVPNAGRELRAVAMLPGNERFATASDDGMLRVHEVETGRLCDGIHAGGALLAACALPDGRDVATIVRPADGGGTAIEVYNLQEPALRRLGQSEDADFSALCALADGTLVAGDEDGGLTLWDLAYAMPLRRWREPDDHSYAVVGQPRRTIEGLVGLAGGTHVASLAAGRWLSVWNVQTGELEWCAEIEGLESIALADRSLAAVRLGGGITFHDPDTGAVEREVDVELPGRTTAFALHAPTMTAAWATDISSWRFFFGRAELYTASLAAETVEPGLCGTHDIQVGALAIDATGAVLVAAGLNGTVSLWDLRSRASRRDSARHRGRVSSVELFDREHKLLTASDDGTVKVWRSKDGVLLRQLAAVGQSARVTSAAVIDQSRAVYAREDGETVVVDLKTGRRKWSERIHRDGMGVVVAAPAVDGFLTGDRYGWVRAWSPEAKTWRGRTLGAPGDVVDGILLAGKRSYALAWDCSDGRIQAFDLTAEEGNEHLWSSGFAGWNRSVAALPGKRCVFPIEKGGAYAVAGVSLPTGERLFRLAGFTEVVTSLAAAPGAHELAAGMRDGSLVLCDLRTGANRLSLVGHTRPVVALCYLGKRLLVSISMDYTLRLWDTARAEALAVFGADGPLHQLTVTEDGERLVVTELSGRMHFLELQRAE
jgi:WD40 repeat protein